MRNGKASKHPWSCFRILSLYLTGFCAFTHLPKSVCSSSLGWMYPEGIPSRTEASAWKLPEAWETSLPSWPSLQQYFKHFGRRMCAKVSWNHCTSLFLKFIIMRTSRQFLLECSLGVLILAPFSLGILILGQIIFPIRHNCKGEGFVRGRAHLRTWLTYLSHALAKNLVIGMELGARGAGAGQA